MQIGQKAFTETMTIILQVGLNPVFGILAFAISSTYYLSMLKTNVINKDFDRSWKKFFKSIVTSIFTKTNTNE